MKAVHVSAEVDPTELAEQMRDVTDRLREQAWMVAPLTTSAPLAEEVDPVPEVADDGTPT